MCYAKEEQTSIEANTRRKEEGRCEKNVEERSLIDDGRQGESGTGGDIKERGSQKTTKSVRDEETQQPLTGFKNLRNYALLTRGGAPEYRFAFFWGSLES